MLVPMKVGHFLAKWDMQKRRAESRTELRPKRCVPRKVGHFLPRWDNRTRAEENENPNNITVPNDVSRGKWDIFNQTGTSPKPNCQQLIAHHSRVIHHRHRS